MGGKRGQFTVFVILGFVLVVAFSFMLFARNAIVEAQLQARAEKIVDETLRTTNINHYVTSCLESITNEAVSLIGLQGGVIYKRQGGMIDLGSEGEDFIPFEYNHTIYNISYGLVINRNESCLEPNPPNYPFANTYLKNIQSKYHLESVCNNDCSSNSGSFGWMSLSFLCDPDGSNKQGISTNNPYSCGSNYGSLSIQKQLQEFISNKTSTCVNFSLFEDTFGYNITILNQPNTTLFFGRKGFSVQTKYPFIVRVGSSDVKTFVNFEIKKSYRLKELVEFLVKLLREEATNPLFNLRADYKTFRGTSGWDSAIDVIVKSNACEGCAIGVFDDVVQIIDNKTLIDGAPFVFQFAIKNRIPALDWINSGGAADIVVMEGQEIHINPRSIDPDENLLSYNYSWWKEDYDEVFDSLCCQQQGSPAFCIQNCVTRNSIIPHNWSLSDEYLDTQRNASYKTKFEDTGFHNVKLLVKDEEGLSDWQNISILVFDLPVAVMQARNDYSNIKNNNASIEDFYYLDSSLSHAYLSPITKFRWTDSREPFEIETRETIRVIPNETGVDIKTITLFNFSKNSLMNANALKVAHEISLEVYTNIIGWSYPPDTEEIVVHQCLPHRSTVDPYPFNTGDPFQADHTCCSDEAATWGEITTNNLCFEFNQLTCFPSQNLEYYPANLAVTDNVQGNVLVAAVSQIRSLDWGDKNDIYMHNYTQKCSGNRGNVCSGIVDDYWELAVSCNNKAADEIATCQGPCDPSDSGCNVNSCPGISSPTIITNQCYDYKPGETFEKNFLRTLTSSLCSDNLKCATDFGNNNGVFGINGLNDKNFKCQGECFGGGCNYPVNCVCGFEDDKQAMCGASKLCDGKLPGYSWSITLGPQKETGCSDTCQEVNCLYYVFDSNSKTCKTTANSDADCDDSFVFDDDTYKCIKCTDNIETGGDEPQNTCESSCPHYDDVGSDKCDEEEHNKFICSGNIDTGGFCSDICKHTDATHQCESSCPGYSGDPACDNIAPDSNNLNTCKNAGQSYFLDICTGSCGLIDSKVCSSQGVGCTADAACNGKMLGDTCGFNKICNTRCECVNKNAMT
ncbi:MAG: hypothetical protein ABIC91_01335 [Nanoarchaeota archaeon]|nr:hypothetical protein [Nanoarchaeota archaeon]MBU1029876.1 hypothetical protein [Nanoarchaeota archaeon]MBU1849403.1 hypothetical protein [Nanoarchaeota archaeon]